MNLKDVEKVEITCLVDNNVDVLLPSSEVASRPAIPPDWFKRPLLAEHGFCAVLTVQSNGSSRALVIDSGLDPYTALHNAGVLGLDLKGCQGLISSHGHVDHAGGLLRIRSAMDTGRGIPLILHNDAFKNRMVKFADGRKIELPAPDRATLKGAGYQVVEKQSYSTWLDDTVLVTGEIPRTNDFEKGFPNHYSESDGGKMEPDPLIMDDQAVVVNVKDHGLVIITGCGHAGIVNTVNYARELTGESRVYAVVGGMHLSGRLFEPIIGRTVDALEDFRPQYIVPCHCTGLKAVSEIARALPGAFLQNSVGTKYLF